MSAYPNTATKEELVEAHREKMRSRKIHRYVRQINVRGPWYWRPRKGHNTRDGSADHSYFKSIWPKGKVAKPGRMG